MLYVECKLCFFFVHGNSIRKRFWQEQDYRKNLTDIFNILMLMSKELLQVF